MKITISLLTVRELVPKKVKVLFSNDVLREAFSLPCFYMYLVISILVTVEKFEGYCKQVCHDKHCSILLPVVGYVAKLAFSFIKASKFILI